jgi:hypothetical protein
MTSPRFTLINASTFALILAGIALTGCSSNGTLRVEDPLPPVAPAAPVTTPIAQSATGAGATNTGSTVSSVGGVVQAAGSSVASTEMAGVDKGVMTGLGGAVQQVGNAVDILGQGTGNSFGQSGNPEADMLAITLQSAPLVVEQVGGAVSSVGDAVAAVDNGALNALSLVTDPAGAQLNQTGAGVASLSGNMTDAMAIPVVQQVTRSGSTLIHMIAIEAEATTQYLGASTGLGMPVNDLLVGAGLTVNQLGKDIATTFAASPVLASTGPVVSSAGTLVASVGGLVTSPTTPSNTTPSTFGNVIASLSSTSALGSAPTSPSSPLTSLTTQPAFSNVIASLSSAPSLGTAPTSMGNVLSTVTAPLAGLLGR